MSYFRQSGKFTVAYMKIAGEKEYYLASAFEEIYAPPTASLSLRGFSVSGECVRSLHSFIECWVLLGAVADDRGGGEGEKEYYMASAFEETCAPPTASLSLRGFFVSGECGGW